MTGTEFSDIRYEVVDGATALITIDRPEVYNAFRGITVEELVTAFRLAWADPNVRCVILTGAGSKAFCTGGDTKTRAAFGNYGPTKSGLWDIEYLHKLIRDIPKPVIAAVNGYAIGGGHVLHVICDVTIAAEHAIFGQVGPRVGSFDAGLGTGYLARVVGEKRAREIWFFCRQYGAEQALSWGLVNKIVPSADLILEARSWGKEIADLSPTAIKFLKQSFAVDSETLVGVSSLATSALDLFVQTEEGQEGARAFVEKRRPEFRADEPKAQSMKGES